MNFSFKMVICISLIVLLLFSAGSIVMICSNFTSQLNSAIDSCTERHILTRYSLETKIISDQMKGTAFTNDDLARYADQLSSYSTDSMLRIILENQTVFSNQDWGQEHPGDGEYMITQANGANHLIFKSNVTVGKNAFKVVTGYNIERVFTERQRQYETFLLVLSAVLIVNTAITALVSRYITKPIKKLSIVSGRIASGVYDERTNIKTQDELGELSNSFDKMVDTLQVEMDRRTAFVADFSHELKTPMTSMMGYSDILRSKQCTSDEIYEYADAIYKNSCRLESLSSSMMALLGLSQRAVEFAALSTDKIKRQVSVLFPKQAYVEYDIEPSYVFANGELIVTLLRNLIENAVNADEGSKSISVKGKAGPCKYLFTVKDHGCGMTQDQVLHAMDPFFMADRSRARSQGGSGLGLSICKKICEIHGSGLSIKSAVGKGTEAAFCLEVCHEQNN